MKIACWNVNGIRAVAKKGFYEVLDNLDVDILCLQETKAQDDQVSEVLFGIDGYSHVSNSAVKKGYSGTCIITRKEPISVTKGLGIEEHDTEGRVLCAEYDDFYLVTVYTPNSGSALVRLPYRQGWDKEFAEYLVKLDKIKPVICCGDFNVAHQEIDIARPKPNYNKTSGYTQKEIDGFSALLERGFTDSFRSMYPEKVQYSWWSYRGSARANNIGWRLDYFVVSNRFMEQVTNSEILPEITLSDHCPILLSTTTQF